MSDGKVQKTLLICQLADIEIVIFYRWMREVYRQNLPDAFDIPEIKKLFLNNIRTHAVYSFAHYVLFGSHIAMDSHLLLNDICPKVLASMHGLKEKLCSQIVHSCEITARNSHIKERVTVSRHALERFYQRVQDSSLSVSEGKLSEKLITKFQESFERAGPTEIPKNQRVVRIINNDFKRVLYFFDQVYNLRFVVLEKEPIIVTVERPR